MKVRAEPGHYILTESDGTEWEITEAEFDLWVQRLLAPRAYAKEAPSRFDPRPAGK